MESLHLNFVALNEIYFFHLFMMARRIETEKVQTKRIEMNRCCWCALDEGGR